MRTYTESASVKLTKEEKEMLEAVCDTAKVSHAEFFRTAIRAAYKKYWEKSLVKKTAKKVVKKSVETKK